MFTVSTAYADYDWFIVDNNLSKRDNQQLID